MNERHVTAVVLLSGATTAGTHDALHAALTAQTRLPDRVVVAVPSDLDEDVRAALESLTASGEVDRLVDVTARPDPSLPGRAAAVEEVLDALAAQHERTLAPVDAPEPAAQSSTRRAGRRARAVDVDALERERTQRAEALARVPERLREEGPRSGRRAGLAEGAPAESWL